MQYHSRTIFSSLDDDDSRTTAESLMTTILLLCNTSKISFEDPDFGPPLSKAGLELEQDFNQALQRKLDNRSYETIAKTYRRAESNRTKCLQNIVGPSGRIDPTQLTWRSNDFATSSVVSENSTPSYPVQGAVGDCWLLGAMSMVAVTRPKLLQEIFVCPTGDWSAANKRGRYGTIPMSTRDVYVVRLFHELRWHYVVIDGRIPRGHSGRPTFGRCADATEVWVSLIEKAAAKLVGGYDKLHQAGTVDFGLHMLTGCSTHTIRGGGFQGNTLALEDTTSTPKEQQELVSKESSAGNRTALFAQLSQFITAGFAVGCERRQRLQTKTGQVQQLSRKSPSARASFTDVDGLLIRHTYVVVDVGEVGGTRLVRLVNPWMVNPWPTGQVKKGPWSRDSTEMTENEKVIQKLFQEKVRRNRHTGEMMQYIPSFATRTAPPAQQDPQEPHKQQEMEEEDDFSAMSDFSDKTPNDFLMTFETFIETMSHVHVSFIAPLDSSSWKIRSVTGKWQARVGGCAAPGHDLNKWSKNPRYKMIVPEENVSVSELERRKRSQVQKKTSVTTLIVALRQAMKPTVVSTDKEPTVLGFRFVPCGQASVPTIIENTVPGRIQPYHVSCSGNASVSLNVRTSSVMDIVPDNYRVGAIADFVLTVVS